MLEAEKTTLHFAHVGGEHTLITRKLRGKRWDCWHQTGGRGRVDTNLVCMPVLASSAPPIAARQSARNSSNPARCLFWSPAYKGGPNESEGPSFHGLAKHCRINSSKARASGKSPNHIDISPSHDNMCSNMSSSKLDPFICASA